MVKRELRFVFLVQDGWDEGLGLGGYHDCSCVSMYCRNVSNASASHVDPNLTDVLARWYRMSMWTIGS